MERDHAKEKQKLVKDKDAGTFHVSQATLAMRNLTHFVMSSQRATHQGEPDENQNGESGS